MKITAFCLTLLLLLVAICFPSGQSKIVVLGIAQDGGIPQIGCTQPICRTQRHPVSSLALLSSGKLFLIDATPDLREQHFALTERYPEAGRENLFDGVLLTHAHMGHYTGLMHLGKESISTKKVPVYCSEEMAGFLKQNAPWSLLVGNGNIELITFQSGKTLRLGDVAVTPLAVPHRKEFTDTHGFLLQGPSKALLYIPDIDAWEPVRENLANWLQKSDVALVDGTFYSGAELPGRDMKLVPHPTVQSSIAFFAALAPFLAQIYFTHLNHTNPLLVKTSLESKELQKHSLQVAAEWMEFHL